MVRIYKDIREGIGNLLIPSSFYLEVSFFIVIFVI